MTMFEECRDVASRCRDVMFQVSWIRDWGLERNYMRGSAERCLNDGSCHFGLVFLG